jgi:lysophospholipase L1-like esterase
MMRYLSALCLLLLLSIAAHGKGPVTIYLAGDSTMAEKRPDKRPETGWGELLQQFFDPPKVRVENHAQNGRSTKTFIAEGRWPALVEKLKPGDYVFIQFGHNDQPKEKASHTPPADYRANLVRFVNEVRARKATPVLFTPVVRRRFDDKGEFYDTHFEYPDIVRSVAAEQKVALIDMHRKSERVLRQYGAEGSKQLFLQLQPGEHANYPKGVEDNTHFSPRGAEEMAQLAVEGVRELKLGLARHLKKKSEVRSRNENPATSSGLF